MDLPNSLPFGVLRVTHPEYTLKLWNELQDFYVGGYQILDRAKQYAGQRAGEQDANYGDRVGGCAYINYLGEIVDYFVAALFSQDLEITEAPNKDDVTKPAGMADDKFYTAFSEDADLRGNSFASVMRDAFRDTILMRKALIGCDFPAADDVPPVNRAAEDALGSNRAYVYSIPNEQLINWECDRWGQFTFATVYTTSMDQKSPATPRGEVIHHCWKIWTIEPGGRANWATYETDEYPNKARLELQTPIPQTGFGETSFRQIPIVRVEVRDGLWVGAKIGPLAKEHFIRRSVLVEAENQSMQAIPYIKRGPEMSAIGSALPSQTQQNPNRGSDPVGRARSQGWVGLGSDDEIGFAEPVGSAYAQVALELDQLKDEMHRVVHQMAASVDNSASSTRRSGASKQQDRAAEAIVLGQFGKDVREAARRVYTMISEARGEGVVWVPRGLDRFELTDRADLLAEAVQVDLVRIPSKTLMKEYKIRLADALTPNLPSATQDKIRKEIEDAVEKQDLDGPAPMAVKPTQPGMTSAPADQQAPGAAKPKPAA